MQQKTRSAGFTVLELIVVITVLVILCGVVAFGYKGIEAGNRNRARMTALDAIQVQLETFYQVNSYYPSLRDMNDNRWIKTGLKNFDTDLLRDPTGTSVALEDTPQAGSYSYQPRTSTGESCEANDQTCATYTLTATLEGDSQYVKVNRN